MFNLTPAGMRSGLIAFSAVFFVLQLSSGLFIDPGFIILHFAFLADQIDVRIFSSRHNSILFLKAHTEYRKREDLSKIKILTLKALIR